MVIEHGGGSGAAYPVARDVLTFLYDRQKAMDVLTELEKSWGGTIEERMDIKMAAYRARKKLETAIAEKPVEANPVSTETGSSAAAADDAGE